MSALYQWFSLSGMPEHPDGLTSRINGTTMPLARGYTACVGEDRAWRDKPEAPTTCGQMVPWIITLPMGAVVLADFEPFIAAPKGSRALGDLCARLAEARTARPDVRVYAYGAPFAAWTPDTRPFSPELAKARDATEARNIGLAKSGLFGLIDGLAVDLYVPWEQGVYLAEFEWWQRYIRRRHEDAVNLMRLGAGHNAIASLIGVVCPVRVGSPKGTQAPISRLAWSLGISAIADIFGQCAVWWGQTRPYADLAEHIEDAAKVWDESTRRN